MEERLEEQSCSHQRAWMCGPWWKWSKVQHLIYYRYQLHILSPKYTCLLINCSYGVACTLFNFLVATFLFILKAAGGCPASLRSGRWLDLYSGTGSVGIEALSRGCSEVLMFWMSRLQSLYLMYCEFFENCDLLSYYLSYLLSDRISLLLRNEINRFYQVQVDSKKEFWRFDF